MVFTKLTDKLDNILFSEREVLQEEVDWIHVIPEEVDVAGEKCDENCEGTEK